jgi:hypothetical protein
MSMSIAAPAPVGLSVIVPVLNSPRELARCLEALLAQASPGTEVIVVDDGSTDETAAVAARTGVRLFRLARTSGPAAARNHGAREAFGDILLFVDADVVLASDATDRVTRAFGEHADVAAIFGSYDARPAAPGLVSQYRNLLHHYTHQHANGEASTFWAGCGAIRRSVFEAMAGFDAETFRHPSIEDIDLGVRMRRAGYRICLDKALQGKHLKRWTLASMIRTDVTRRATPWAKLILEGGRTPDDLNLKRAQRVSGALVALAAALAPLGVIQWQFAAAATAALGIVIFLNRDLYAFLARQGGWRFSAGCIPLHLLYYGYSVMSYGLAWLSTHLRNTYLGWFFGEPEGRGNPLSTSLPDRPSRRL